MLKCKQLILTMTLNIQSVKKAGTNAKLSTQNGGHVLFSSPAVLLLICWQCRLIYFCSPRLILYFFHTKKAQPIF